MKPMWQINDRDLENLLMHVVTCKPGFDDILNRISDRLNRSSDIIGLLMWYIEFKPDIEYPFDVEFQPDIDKLFYDKIRELRKANRQVELDKQHAKFMGERNEEMKNARIQKKNLGSSD